MASQPLGGSGDLEGGGELEPRKGPADVRREPENRPSQKHTAPPPKRRAETLGGVWGPDWGQPLGPWVQSSTSLHRHPPRRCALTRSPHSLASARSKLQAKADDSGMGQRQGGGRYQHPVASATQPGYNTGKRPSALY